MNLFVSIKSVGAGGQRLTVSRYLPNFFQSHLNKQIGKGRFKKFYRAGVIRFGSVRMDSGRSALSTIIVWHTIRLTPIKLYLRLCSRYSYYLMHDGHIVGIPAGQCNWWYWVTSMLHQVFKPIMNYRCVDFADCVLGKKHLNTDSFCETSLGLNFFFKGIIFHGLDRWR